MPRSLTPPTNSGSHQPASAPTLRSTPRGACTGTTERMEHEALGNLQAELFQARVTLNQLRAELVRHHDTNDPAAADRDEINARAARSIAGLDGIISRVHRQISQR
jgi:hypothetical protein